MLKRFLSLTLLLPLLLVYDGWGQVTIAMQDFDAVNTMTYSVSGGTTYTGSSASNDVPASSAFFTSSQTGYGISNGTSTLTFGNVTGLSSYTSKYFEFRLASFQIGATVNGADAGDIVSVDISTDNASTWSREVRVLGFSNATWHYSTGTGNASVTYDGNNTPTDFQPSTGGAQTTRGYSTVRVNLPDVGTQARIRIILLNNAAGERWVIDDVKLMGTLLLSPPILTSDNTFNNVDNEIDITFTDDATWRGASPVVKVNDTTLTSGTDYVLSMGVLKLKPSGGRGCLRTASIKTVKVSATGYTDATVTQTINVGAVNATTSTTTISGALALSTTRTVTATAKDQYNNLVSGYTFKYDATITNNNVTTGESYSIDGIGRTASVTDINLTTATDASGVATFTIAIPVTVDDGDGVSVQVQLADGATSIGSSFSYTKPLTTPTLVADGTSNNVDNDIDITFTDSPSWRGAITAVKIGGISLTLNTDYVISEGNIKLKPSGSNSPLRIAGGKAVTVEATGYDVASVTQQIDAGAPTTNSTAAINSPLAINSSSTVTLTAKDQYNNLVSGYTFKYDVTITDNNATTDESYTIDGTGRTVSVNDQSVVAQTDASGVSTFAIAIPPLVDVNDGISVKVQLADGTTNIGSAFSFTYIPPPNVAISAMVPINANFILGRDNNILQRFDMAVTGGDVTLNSLTVATAGTYAVADIKTNGFKLWYSTDTVFSSISDALISTKAVVVSSNNIVFNSLSSTVSNNSTGSFFVTVDISSSATTNNTIQISSTAHSNIVFATATLTGVNPVSAGGTKTIVALTLPLVEHFDYAVGSVTTNGAGWVNTSGTAGQVTVENGNLTYTGYEMPATGRSITITPTESEDVRLVFPNVTSGKVYASCLINVSASTVAGDYFLHLGNGTGNFTSRVYAKQDGAGYALAIGKTAVGSTYSSTLNYNQTYLIVLGYEIIGAVASDDVVRLWINPDLSGAEPSSTLSYTAQNDVATGTINGFYVRQSTTIPTATIDAIRISTNWADAPLPVELTSFTAKASGTTVALNWETKTEVDNNGFEVERNATGTWQKIGFVEGHGTANSPKYYSFSDANPLGNKIQYRLKQIDNDGSFEYSPVVEVELAPVNYTLYQNYPNPFNPSTVIRYALPVAGMVTIDVFNALGEKVSTLLNGQVEAGFNQVSFDATNLPSGLYFYRIQSGDFTSIKKMLLMK